MDRELQRRPDPPLQWSYRHTEGSGRCGDGLRRRLHVLRAVVVWRRTDAAAPRELPGATSYS